MAGVALNVGSFRTWYGNFRVTENRAVSAQDFNPARIEPQFDIFNLTNASSVLVMTTRRGPAWRDASVAAAQHHDVAPLRHRRGRPP